MPADSTGVPGENLVGRLAAREQCNQTGKRAEVASKITTTPEPTGPPKKTLTPRPVG